MALKALRAFGLLAIASLAAAQPIPQFPPQSPALKAIEEKYVPGPDSLPRKGVPAGKIFTFTFENSKIYPGTSRKITVYVPAKYRGDKPACVFIGLDGIDHVPIVFDNLITKGDMPVTIAIGIAPGAVTAARPDENPRFNRSNEFDALNGDLARFVLEEILPEVERRTTPDGLPIRLSKDPNDRATGGGSTGAIAAFTLAWERPDAFRRVFSAIGTYVGMRGGDGYPVIVRKTEPKPIRIFMQDGSNDQLDSFLGEVGNWWLSNLTMENALRFAGYQVAHQWGEGGHNGSHMIAVFPEAMRFLWKDWPKPVVAGQTNNVILKGILLPGEGWRVLPGDYQSASALASRPDGQLLFRDVRAQRSWTIGLTGAVVPDTGRNLPFNAAAYGPDGSAYVTSRAQGNIGRYTADGKLAETIDIDAAAMVATHDGLVYATEEGSGQADGKVWLVQPGKAPQLLDSELNHPTGIVVSADGLWLAVAEARTHWGYSYRIKPDGSVDAKQRFYWFHVPDEADESGAGPMVSDIEGRMYAVTHMGVQVFDRNGRSRGILPLPGGTPTSIAFGGADFTTLYVTGGDGRIYARKMKVPGAPGFRQPVKLPQWTAG